MQHVRQEKRVSRGRARASVRHSRRISGSAGAKTRGVAYIHFGVSLRGSTLYGFTTFFTGDPTVALASLAGRAADMLGGGRDAAL